jgi:hypothetical protein
MTYLAGTGYAPTSSHLANERKTHLVVTLSNSEPTNGYVSHSTEERTGHKEEGGKEKEYNKGGTHAEEEEISGGKLGEEGEEKEYRKKKLFSLTKYLS